MHDSQGVDNNSAVEGGSFSLAGSSHNFFDLEDGSSEEYNRPSRSSSEESSSEEVGPRNMGSPVSWSGPFHISDRYVCYASKIAPRSLRDP